MMLWETPTFICLQSTDMVESMVDPDWKEDNVYTIYNFGIYSLQFYDHAYKWGFRPCYTPE